MLTAAERLTLSNYIPVYLFLDKTQLRTVKNLLDKMPPSEEKDSFMEKLRENIDDEEKELYSLLTNYATLGETELKRVRVLIDNKKLSAESKKIVNEFAIDHFHEDPRLTLTDTERLTLSNYIPVYLFLGETQLKTVKNLLDKMPPSEEKDSFMKKIRESIDDEGKELYSLLTNYATLGKTELKRVRVLIDKKKLSAESKKIVNEFAIDHFHEDPRKYEKLLEERRKRHQYDDSNSPSNPKQHIYKGIAYTIHTGTKGGNYIIVNNRKIYIEKI